VLVDWRWELSEIKTNLLSEKTYFAISNGVCICSPHPRSFGPVLTVLVTDPGCAFLSAAGPVGISSGCCSDSIVVVSTSAAF